MNNWTKTKNERCVEKWFNENGFEVTNVKQYISKTKYYLKKDGIDDTFELLSSVSDIGNYMSSYLKSFNMKKEIIELKTLL